MKVAELSKLLLTALLLTGCATDAWRPERSFDVFLEQVRVKCWGLRLGAVSINRLMPNATTTDPYFLDITSRYYHGKISEQSYVTALQGSYAAPADSPGIRCILEQMPKRNADTAPAQGNAE